MPSQEPDLSEHISTNRHDVSREMLTDILLGEPAHEEPQQDTEELSAYTSPASPENSNNHSSNKARDIAMMQLQSYEDEQQPEEFSVANQRGLLLEDDQSTLFTDEV